MTSVGGRAGFHSVGASHATPNRTRPEGGSPLDSEGWFFTGDIGSIDNQGRIVISDRAKDVIKSGGEWISSIVLENLAVGHPKVAEAAVIGVYHPKGDERPLLIVQLKEGESATEQEIIAHCREHLAHFKCPKSIDVLEALPRNATGKILKRELRAPYWEDQERQV